MSDTTNSKKTVKSTKPSKSFDESTQRLETIISLMDDPQTSLEEMIGLVEEGLKLIKESRKILSQAELRIKKLEQLPTPADKAKPEQQTPTNNEFSLF